MKQKDLYLTFLAGLQLLSAGVGIVFKQDAEGVLVVDSVSAGGPADKCPSISPRCCLMPNASSVAAGILQMFEDI